MTAISQSVGVESWVSLHYHRDAGEESPGLHQTEKQDHEGAYEKAPPTATEPAHVPILSRIARLPRKRDNLLDLPNVIRDTSVHRGIGTPFVRAKARYSHLWFNRGVRVPTAPHHDSCPRKLRVPFVRESRGPTK